MARGRSGGNVSLLLAGLLAILLLLAGKTHFLPVERLRTAITDKGGPVFQALNTPTMAVTKWLGGITHVFAVYSDNQQLREENARLLQWRGAAFSLQDQVRHYRKLLKAVPDTSSIVVTADVIAHSTQPFLETVILNAGRRDGLESGQAVLDAGGLLGRIYAAADHTSWVILLTDLNSRIPVEIRPGNIPAILTGNNTAEPRLEAMPQNAKIKNGADIVTSGDGGLLPAGLPVGLIAIEGRETKVALYSNSVTAAEVRVLHYRTPIEQMPKPTDADIPAPSVSPPPTPHDNVIAAPATAVQAPTKAVTEPLQARPRHPKRMSVPSASTGDVQTTTSPTQRPEDSDAPPTAPSDDQFDQ